MANRRPTHSTIIYSYRMGSGSRPRVDGDLVLGPALPYAR